MGSAWSCTKPKQFATNKEAQVYLHTSVSWSDNSDTKLPTKSDTTQTKVKLAIADKKKCLKVPS